MEEFKKIDGIFEPDVISKCKTWVNVDTGEQQKQTLQDHYEKIEIFVLNETVPEEIRGQFNAAKNLLLYSWYVYSFLSAAELQVLSILELALRIRIGDKKLKELVKKNKRGLSAYINYAIEKNWASNDDFRAWHRAPMLQAINEHIISKIQEAENEGVEHKEINLNEIEVKGENNTDYLGKLKYTVNKIRNAHAHGENLLCEPSVWESFEMCADFINVLFYEE